MDTASGVLDEATQYWYERPGIIQRRFFGVFEGGGAKGAAYIGALLAMVENHCWFSAVAGASAGAITAALVAAGLTPTEIESKTDVALRHVRTGVWAGLFRLQRETGYFPSDKLRNWLDDLLRKQVARKSGAPTDLQVTFANLHAATGIELNVVAADLSMKRQIIFSHFHTPDCAVADAIVASSSIPFAFSSCLLQVPDHKSQRLYHHTIVDGGVWSNFPMFIFEDRAFRAHYKLAPEEIQAEQILGFLLKEKDVDRTPPRGKEIKFVEAVPHEEFRALEWEQEGETVVNKPTSLASSLGVCVLYPLSLLGRFVEWNGGVERGRWPAPRSSLVYHFVRSINGLLAGIHPLLFGLLACLVVAIGAYEVTSSLTSEQLRVLRATDWSHWIAYLTRPWGLILASLAVAISILVVFASILAVAANRLLIRAGRRILYGVISTYVAGPGAPEWVAEKKNIIELPIPRNITALKFEMTPEERKHLTTLAQIATDAKLKEILSDRCRMPNGGTA